MPARSARGLIIPRLAYWRTAVSGVSRGQFVKNSSDRDLERELACRARRGGPRKPIGHFSTPERLQRRGDEDETKQKLQHFSGCRPGERSARRRTNKAFNAHKQTYAQQCGAAGKQSYPAIRNRPMH